MDDKKEITVLSTRLVRVGPWIFHFDYFPRTKKEWFPRIGFGYWGRSSDWTMEVDDES